MNATHTPNPWQHIPRARSGHVDQLAYNGHPFVQIGGRGPLGGGDAEQDRNVALLLAAPDLLATLKEVLKEGNGFLLATRPEEYKAAVSAARAAIARAEGGAT